MIARAGSGHIGSSFSSLDIVTWLHLHELRGLEGPEPAVRDLFFSSKGHDVPGLYAVLIGLGRLPFETLHTLRRLGGLPGHPDVETPGIVSNTGPLGMGISKAKGMVRAQRLAGREGRVFVLTGDGELQEGQFWESLATAAHAKMSEITAIVDHNKIQSDTWVSSVSDLGDLVAKVDRVRVACGALRRPRSRRAREDAEVPARRARPPQADRRRHGERAGRVVHGAHRAPRPMRSSTASTAARPTTRLTQRGAAELIASANTELEALGAAAARAGASPASGTGPTCGRRNAWWWPIRVRSLAHAERDPRIVALDADLVLDTGLIPFSRAVSRPLRRVRHRGAGHGLPGGGLALARAAAGGALLRLFPVHPRQRADLQQRDRAAEDGVRRLARRPASGRTRALAPVGARHRGAGGHAGTGDAGAVVRIRGGSGGGVLPRGGPDELLSPTGHPSRAGCRTACPRITGWSGDGAWR